MKREIESMEELVNAVNDGEVEGCGHCDTEFDDDDLGYVVETGECPYCHEVITLINEMEE